MRYKSRRARGAGVTHARRECSTQLCTNCAVSPLYSARASSLIRNAFLSATVTTICLHIHVQYFFDNTTDLYQQLRKLSYKHLDSSIAQGHSYHLSKYGTLVLIQSCVVYLDISVDNTYNTSIVSSGNYYK